MKRYFLTALITFAAALCAACGGDDGSGTIPDPDPNTEPSNEPVVIAFDNAAFESALIAAGVDTDGDGAISEDEAAAVSQLELAGDSAITSLAELNYFTALRVLNCSSTGITQLDITNNLLLESLDCSSTDIGNGTRAADTELDISKNTKLTDLNVSGTLLTQIDLSNNAAIETINVSGTAITEIDVSNNTSLTALDVSGTSVESVDLSNNTAIEMLNVSGTSITELDISNNSALKSLDVSSTSITSLDTTSNKELTELAATDCEDLTELKYDPESLNSSNITINDDAVLVPVVDPMESIKDNGGIGSY